MVDVPRSILVDGPNVAAGIAAEIEHQRGFTELRERRCFPIARRAEDYRHNLSCAKVVPARHDCQWACLDMSRGKT